MSNKSIFNNFSTAPQGDPYWNNVISLLHFNGANNSTSIIDEKGNSWQNDGSPIINTSAKVLGAASLYLDGSSSLNINNNVFAFNADDFTIEAYVYFLSSGPQIILGSSYIDSVYISAFEVSNKFRISGGSTVIVVDHVIYTNTWYHVAMVRKGSASYFFINGVLKAEFVLSSSMDNTNFVIGKYISGNYHMNGYIDELRITKGVARYTANFTPPSQEFPNF